MDFQIHILMHLAIEVELVKAVSCSWMFVLESYIRKLRGFIKQREKPEGSMEESHIVYELFYYVVSTSRKSPTH